MMPSYDGPPIMVCMDVPIRAGICSYRTTKDCLLQLTPAEIAEYGKNIQRMAAWSEPEIQQWDTIDNMGDPIRIFGIEGTPYEVVQVLAKAIDVGPYRNLFLKVPIADEGRRVLFILGACKW